MIVTGVAYLSISLVLIYVGYQDAFFRIIPDWASLALFAGFVVLGLIRALSISEWMLHGLIAGAVFAAIVPLFYFHLMGGGDVKLCSALSLYMGLDHIVSFLLLTSVIGGCLGIARIISGCIADWRTGRPVSFRAGLNAEIPYGIAIVSAALIIFPETRLF
jgi:prepilin peptidase CpaA